MFLVSVEYCKDMLITAGVGGGGHPYKRVCKLQIFCLWDEKTLYLPIQVSLRSLRKKMYKKCYIMLYFSLRNLTFINKEDNILRIYLDPLLVFRCLF